MIELFESVPPWVYLIAAGLATTVSSKMRDFVYRLFSHVIATDYLSHHQVKSSIAGYLRAHAKRSPFGDRVYGAVHLRVHSRDREQYVATLDLGEGNQIFWLKWWQPVFLSNTVTGSGKGPPSSSSETKTRIRYIRGTLNLPKILKETLDCFADEGASVNSNRFRVIRCFGYGSQNDKNDSNSPGATKTIDEVEFETIHSKWSSTIIIGYSLEDIIPKTARTVANLVMSPTASQALEEIHFWRTSKDWFRERAVPWRRGYLLQGPPGTGKTSFVRAVAMELKMPIFMFDLASMSNGELNRAWTGVVNSTPAIALFEDLDSVFDGRRNVNADKHKDTVTFDCLLNCIDGVQESSGILLFITSNHAEILDPALGSQLIDGVWHPTRPGRIDGVVEFGDLNEDGRMKMAARILCGVAQSVMDEVVSQGPCTPAVMQERCFSAAISWRMAQFKPN